MSTRQQEADILIFRLMSRPIGGRYITQRLNHPKIIVAEEPRFRPLSPVAQTTLSPDAQPAHRRPFCPRGLRLFGRRERRQILQVSLATHLDLKQQYSRSTFVDLNRQAGTLFSNRMSSSPYDRPLQCISHVLQVFIDFSLFSFPKESRKLTLLRAF